MLFLGDFIYADVPLQLGRDAEYYRREYRQVYSSPDWPSVSQNLPWIHVIDDHEIQNDWNGNLTGVAVPAYDAFQHYHVAANPPVHREGHTYFSFVQGPADFFLVDTRRYRSPENSNPNDAEKTMLKLHNNQLEEALSSALTRNKRRKTVIEEMRAEDNSATVIFSPLKIQRAREKTKAREEEKAQKEQDRQRRKQERAQKKAQKEVEKQQRRDTRAAAAEARRERDTKKREAAAAAKQAKQAQKQARLTAQSAQRELKARQRVQSTKQPSATTAVEAQIEEMVQQRNARGGRIIRTPARLKT